MAGSFEPRKAPPGLTPDWPLGPRTIARPGRRGSARRHPDGGIELHGTAQPLGRALYVGPEWLVVAVPSSLGCILQTWRITRQLGPAHWGLEYCHEYPLEVPQ